MIRLIALDIDGTLLDTHGLVPQANREAIAGASRLGIEVALVTGRRFDFTRAVTDQIDGPLTLILNNGAVVKMRDGETRLRWLLPMRTAVDVLAGTREFRSNAAAIFDRPAEGQIVVERLAPRDPLMTRYIGRNRPFVVEVNALESAVEEDPIQVMYAGPVGDMNRLLDRLRALADGGRFEVAVTEYAERDLALVDVIATGVSKGSTLAAWAARRGIDRSEVMAIGDNLNDLEMLEFAGSPVVMGNAVEALLGRGWHRTGGNDESGVASAIRRFVLGGT